MSKCVLAYHWSFVLYDVILIKHYKLLLYTTLDINGIHFILLDNIIDVSGMTLCNLDSNSTSL